MENLEPRPQDVDDLVEEVRSQCLWFLDPGYLPKTDAERIWVLGLIARYGSRDVFRRAAELKRWLSRPSSETSAAS